MTDAAGPTVRKRGNGAPHGCVYRAVIGRARGTLAAALLLVALAPTRGQGPVEFGPTLEPALALTLSRVHGLPDGTDARGSFGVEGGYLLGGYLASFPYAGWGWRADLGFGYTGQPGNDLNGDEPGFREGDRQVRLSLEARYFSDAWTGVGFGASLTALERSGLDYPSRNPSYAVAGGSFAVGAHVSWSQIGRAYTLAFRLSATAIPGWAEARVTGGGRVAEGRYTEVAIGPSVRVSVPLNRAQWLRRVDLPPPIYSPRT